MEYARIMIAAAKSGSGKTLVTTGLLGALKKRGLSVSAFKCGPDYIDPMFHRQILGVSSKNLDLYFVDEKTVRGLFCFGNESELSVVEGVMGLYDGVGGTTEQASAYHLACALAMPVVLVVDAHGMGRSVAAEIAGFLAMDREHRIAGIVLNRISGMFYPKLKVLIEQELSVPVLGYLPQNEDIVIESRYLGLKLPEEIAGIRKKAELLADAVEKTVDVDRVIELAKRAEPFVPPFVPFFAGSRAIRTRIAVARDEAFCFYYEDNLQMLMSAGAQLVFFSPLSDERLPEHVEGILLGGGYPELYALKLQENASMRRSIREALAQNMPIVAECGGFMYLHEHIEAKEGGRYAMVGHVKGDCTYQGHLVRFGYVEIAEKAAHFLPEGVHVRGHEFHYYDSTENGSACTLQKPVSGRGWEGIHADENSWYGFAHLYYPSAPEFVRAFVDACVRYGEGVREE